MIIFYQMYIVFLLDNFPKFLLTIDHNCFALEISCLKNGHRKCHLRPLEGPDVHFVVGLGGFTYFSS